jgi:DNA-binding MarR family transcriptional regulator
MIEVQKMTAPRSQRRGLGASLRLAHHLYGKILHKRLVNEDLTMAQYVHLRTLKEEGPITQSELSAQMGIEKASSTRVLDELEQKKLILRERQKSDRRVIVVSLSDHGLEKIEEVMRSARQVAETASRGFDDDDLHRLFVALDKMIDNLSSSS